MTSVLHSYTPYKSQLDHLDTVISNPNNYTASNGKNAIQISTSSLRLAREELKADMEKGSKAINADGVRIATEARAIWDARLPILKKAPSATTPGALKWLLNYTLGWPCAAPAPAPAIVPGMVGKFSLTGTTPLTYEFPSSPSTTLLTGFTSLRMGPRKTGIKVALSQAPIDNMHTTFALTTPRAPDSATCTFLDPARCGPSAQHGTVGFDIVNTEQPPPLSIPIVFATPFTSTPQVVVWLSALDFVTGSKLAVETRAANMTPSGFTLFVTGLMDLPRAANTVSWVAFEEAAGIVSGTFVMGKGGSYAGERFSERITGQSEVFMAFNTFSGPPDGLLYEIGVPKIEEGRLAVEGSSVNKSLCSTGVAYLVFPPVK